MNGNHHFATFSPSCDSAGTWARIRATRGRPGKCGWVRAVLRGWRAARSHVVTLGCAANCMGGRRLLSRSREWASPTALGGGSARFRRLPPCGPSARGRGHTALSPPPPTSFYKAGPAGLPLPPPKPAKAASLVVSHSTINPSRRLLFGRRVVGRRARLCFSGPCPAAGLWHAFGLLRRSLACSVFPSSISCLYLSGMP